MGAFIHILRGLRPGPCPFHSTGPAGLHETSGSPEWRRRVLFPLDRRGFTLLEMLVSLMIGTLIVGGVMGLISVSLQSKFRIRDKSQIQPILESAAQIILADPARVAEGNIQLAELPGSPVVDVVAAPVQLPEGGLAAMAGQLCRVMLIYKSGQLEFSVIVPPAGTH